MKSKKRCMRVILLITLIISVTCYKTVAQSDGVIFKKVDTVIISPIKKIIILEPIVPFDDRIIKNTIKSAVVEEIDTILDYHFVDNDLYVTKINNSITIKRTEIINSQKDFDAILIIIYSLDVVYDYSLVGMYSPLVPFPESENYSKIKMFLFDKNGDLIRKKSSSALSADRFGFTQNPLRGFKTATSLSTYSIIKKILSINRRLL